MTTPLTTTKSGKHLRVAIISVHGNPMVPDHDLGSDGKGGQNIYVREVGKELSQLNCDVTWFTRSESPDEVGVVNLSPTLRCQYIVAGPQEHVNRDFLFPYLEQFVNQIDGDQYDVVFTNYWLSGFVGTTLNQTYGLPQVHIHHSLGEVKYKHANMPAIGPVRLRIEELLNKCVACMIHQTESEVKSCQSTKPVLIKPGVNLKRFQKLSRQRAKSILGFEDDILNVLFVGRITREKGIQYALDALSNTSVPHKFRLIGKKCKTFQVTSKDPRAEFLGSKTPDEVALHMAASDILIMPSMYEAFGIVAIEAIAAGCCLIGSATGGLNEIIKHGVNGFKVPPGDAKAIRDAFEKMACDATLRDTIRITNLKVANQYSWQATASQIRQKMLEITSSTASSSSSEIQCV